MDFMGRFFIHFAALFGLGFNSTDFFSRVEFWALKKYGIACYMFNISSTLQIIFL